jgi:hypothetical protein
MRSQPFADFSADCPGVGVINLNAVAHSGIFVPVNAHLTVERIRTLFV